MLAGLITYTISAPVLFQFICLCPQNWKCFEYIKFLVLINLQEKRGGGSCFKSRRNDCRSACVFWASSLQSFHWTAQSFAVTVWTYATPELSPCSCQCAVEISGKTQKKSQSRRFLDVKQKPLFYFVLLFLVICLFSPLLFLPKVATAHYLILLSVLRRLLSLGPNPASELWYCVLLLFLWDN